MNRLAIFGLLALSFFWAPALVVANPQLVIEEAITNAKEIVNTDKNRVSDKELRAKLEEAVFPAFDFREMARRALGPPWKRATKAEQSEYVDLFSKLLSRNYYKKVVENIGDSEYTVSSSQTNDGKALVKTEVAYDGDNIAINYRLRNKSEKWRVYDIIVENVSLVSNYRSEFGSIVRRKKMSGLLEMLRKKTAKLSSA